MLTDYTKADFPFDTFTTEGTPVRLIGAHAGRVIGYLWWAAGKGHEDAYSIDARAWDEKGIYSKNHPSLNLIPPPGDVDATVAALEDEMLNCQGRLDGMPDAPAEWRAVDEKRIAVIKSTIAKLRPAPAAE